MYHLRMTKGRSRRAGIAGAEIRRGATREEFAGIIRYKRDRFPTNKPMLRGRNVPLTAAESIRLERWARR